VGGTRPAERERRELRDRELLYAALINGRTLFASGPYEAHIGFSNVCNMSCVMCWNGANPPPRKMTPQLLARIDQDIAPRLSVITPYNGSEPLIVSWDETRRMCEEHSIMLSLTTNGSFLDERRFTELRDITETLFVSIDSHIPEIFERIRPGAKADAIYANLRTAARLAREAGLECIVNTVFMTENGPHLPETVEFFADSGIESVHILQMLDVNGRSGWSNPLVHFSAEYVADIKRRCFEVAERRKLKLFWDVAGGAEGRNFIEGGGVQRKRRKAEYDQWSWRLKNLVPGFCYHAYDRLRIDTDGSVAPCSYSTDGELELGYLGDVTLEEMWNGARMRDLRRAHFTWDYPSICATCRFKDPPPPRPWLPVLDELFGALRLDDRIPQRSIEHVAPVHMTRQTEAPVLSFRRPDAFIDRLFVGAAMGGEADELEVWAVEPDADPGEVVHFAVPEAAWAGMRANVGWWWGVFGFAGSGRLRVQMSRALWCIVRHRALPRVPGSGLRYPEMGATVVDLGSSARPAGDVSLAERRHGDPWANPRRHRSKAHT
jgi:radical SAM protein with 4Fe4S-binding SPASM domain